MPELVRWINWGHWIFERASSVAILEQHLPGRDWLFGGEVTYADFRVACVLPFAELAGLPGRFLARRSLAYAAHGDRRLEGSISRE